MEKILIVDDGMRIGTSMAAAIQDSSALAGYGAEVVEAPVSDPLRSRGNAAVLSTMAGIMAMAESFGGIPQPRYRWKPPRQRHEPHQGSKEKARRAKQVAKRKAP